MVEDPSPPELTVALAVDSLRTRCELALEAILTQESPPRFEVLLLDLGSGKYPPVAGSDDLRVRTIPIQPGAGYGETAARAASEARAPVVAFVEEHVQVGPGWARAIVQAHRGPWAAVCGELHPGDLGRPVAVRIELISRQRWSPPARRGEAQVLRWQNVSYKRDKIVRYGSRLPLLLQSEGALFRQLRADGERLYVEPDAKAIHAHEHSWPGFLRGTFYSNRIAAASAAEASGYGWAGFWKPLASALTGPLRWPLVLWRRTRTMPEPSFWTRTFWKHSPFVFQYYLTAAAATVVGLLAGRGDSARQFLSAELNQPRLIPDRAEWLAGSRDAG
jgi:hypothetical protein